MSASSSSSSPSTSTSSTSKTDDIPKHDDIWRVSVERPVYWGDMDANRHVNNLVYLRWFQDMRLKYLEQMDPSITTGDYYSRPYGFSLVHQWVTYHSAVIYRIHPTVTVRIRAKALGDSTITYETQVVTPDGEIACRGESVVVYIDLRTGAKVSLDQLAVKQIRTFEHPRQIPRILKQKL